MTAGTPRGSNRGGGPRGSGDRGGGGDRGGDRGQRRDRREREREEEREELDERVIDITRVAKVVKGGRHFAFRTVVVVGDNRGKVGIGIGKSRGVPDSIRKGSDHARRLMYSVQLSGTTIPHEVIGKHGGAIVLLKPASPGTGVIAAAACRCGEPSASVTSSAKSRAAPTCSTWPTPRWTRSSSSRAWKNWRRSEVRHRSILPFWRRKRAGSGMRRNDRL
jgi:ribosomal protein S5